MAEASSNIRVLNNVLAEPLSINPHEGGVIHVGEVFLMRLLDTIQALEAEREMERLKCLLQRGITLEAKPTKGADGPDAGEGIAGIGSQPKDRHDQ